MFRVTTNQWIQSRTSFSGSDIQVSFEDIRIGTLQAISVSVSREKGPIYVLGSEIPISFSRGKRGVAGTLQFATLDRTAFYDVMYGTDPNHIATYARKLTEIHIPGVNFATRPLTPGGRSDLLGGEQNPNVPLSQRLPGQIYGTVSTGGVPLAGQNYSLASASPSPENFWQIGVAESYCMYPDQIMPFDVTLMAMNEFGQMGVARVFGVELLNMGVSVSTDDLDLAETYTFIAQSFVGMQPIYWDRQTIPHMNRYLTFGVPGGLTVGGKPGEAVPPWPPFVPTE